VTERLARSLWRAGWALLLGACLFALVPLAQASPPDQTWIGGFYDDADGDDVIVAITGAVGIVHAAPPVTVEPLRAVAELVAPDAEDSPPRSALGVEPGRAPPYCLVRRNL
jgi:hypothetical protein